MNPRVYKASYFLPGKVEREIERDGCDTNLLSKKVFDCVPSRVKEQQEGNERYGLLADGIRLTLYGIIRLAGRVRDVCIEENFLVIQLTEDDIQGMPFLAAHDCKMDFAKPVISVAGRELVCTDKHGRLMVSGVQAWKKIDIQPQTEASVMCRITEPNFAAMGIIEGCNLQLPIACSLNKSVLQGKVMIRCINVGTQPIELKAGQLIASYTAVSEKDIQIQEWEEKKVEDSSMRSPNKMPTSGYTCWSTSKYFW